MTLKIRWPYFLVFFLLFAFLGYFRQKFFLAYNHLMYIKYFQRTTAAPLDNIANVFNNTSYKTMYYLKYPLTILSVALFYLLNYLAVKYASSEKKLLKWVTYTYGLLLSLAAASMLYGYFIHQRLQDDEYTLSRWLLGIAQSPLIALIMIASGQLLQNHKHQTSEKEQP